MEQGKLTIRPFNPQHLGGSSLDLTLSEKGLTFNEHKKPFIDPKEPTEMKKLQFDKEGIFLRPEQFLIASTREFISLPDNIVARIEGRSSLARLGIVVHSTGGFVDAGFQGNLTLEMSNLNVLPVKLYPGMRIAQLTFLRQDKSSKKPYGKRGKYQGQKGPTSSKIFLDFQGEDSN